MPTKAEKDKYSGTEIRDHEWDGIRELNTPLPKWWVYVFAATVVWAVVYVIFFPFIPGQGVGFFGKNQRILLAENIAEAEAAQARFVDGIAAASYDEIQADAELFNFSITGGRAAFADNCAPCHGGGGAGRPGFPVLADDDWLWGGTVDEIAYSIIHGIRNETPDSRFSEMPAFEGVFSREEVDDIVAYVDSLSGLPHDAEAAARGVTGYADNCASCHGDQGLGLRELGAPRLSDQIWLYSSNSEEIASQILRPKHGVMPAWQNRLSETTIKMLTLYVHSLGGGE